MKKLINPLLVSMLAITLTACGGNSTNGDSSGIPTAAELITRSAEASKELKSFTITSSVVQHIEIEAGDQKQTQDANMDLTQDIVINPMQIYQEVKMTMPGVQDTSIKQYLTQEGVYTNAGDGAWTKIGGDEATQILKQLESSIKIDQQLTSLEPYANDLKVTEGGDTYVLTADLSGDSIKKLAGSLMGQTGTEDAQAQTMLDQMNIDDLKVTSVIHKSSYLPTKALVDMTLSMEQNGQKMSTKMQMTSEFSKYNELDKIVIPDEVLNSAK